MSILEGTRDLQGRLDKANDAIETIRALIERQNELIAETRSTDDAPSSEQRQLARDTLSGVGRGDGRIGSARYSGRVCVRRLTT
ncbi:MAG: hypothetical protein U5N86_11710 [Planctomycetota bacterium]|nr:hypothetical protein [Planctomycetota bacterium]